MKITISYDAIDEDNTFSSGDFITGRVILEVSKKTTINTLSIKAKGQADVSWTESDGEDSTSYSAHERYFKLKQFFIHHDKGQGQDNELLLTTQRGEIYPNDVPPGIHVYPFTFQLPQGKLPSSFKGKDGNIVYVLEAKLTRTMRLRKIARTEFTFLTNIDQIIPHLMEPSCGSVEKKMKLFTSGKVSMRVNIEKTGYTQGETLKILVDIENSSSRALKPKFALEQRQTFIATSSRKNQTKRIFKEVGEPVPSASQQRVIKTLQIPSDLTATMHYCSIIEVEYTLQVYLDVPLARDPTVIIPLTILPTSSRFEKLTHPSMLNQSQPYGHEAQAGWNFYPPQTTPEGYPPQCASGGYLPQTASGGYLPQTAPEGCPPQAASVKYPPQGGP